MNLSSRPKRKRIPTKKYAKFAQRTKQSTVIAKPKTTRRKRRRKQHVQSGPSTPKVTSKTKRKKKRKPATKALTPVPPSVSMPRSNIMHMCDCGLLHATLDVVTSPHKAHASSCLLHNQAEPPCTLPIFHPMTNTRLARRKKNNTVHLELSAVAWVSRWLDKNGCWPTTHYPWVQWAVNYHPKSEFIWYVGSTQEQVASRSESFAIRGSRERDDFDKRLSAWWEQHARSLLPLRNRGFKQVNLFFLLNLVFLIKHRVTYA